jgi:transposase-like protein
MSAIEGNSIRSTSRMTGFAHIWTSVAIDQDSRLIITWLVGERDDVAAREFIGDLGSRLPNRVEITTDGHKPYLTAIEGEFGANVRRFTRLTKAFSKKVENHAAAVSLNMMWQNFGRPHKSLANPYPRTPAMAAGVADHI